MRSIGDRVFDHRDNVLIRSGHHLDKHTAGRLNVWLAILQKHTKHHSRRDLFRLREVVREIFRDFARYDGNRADVWIAMQSDLETGFANDVECSLADDAAHIKLPISAWRLLGVRIFHVTAHVPVTVRFADNSADFTRAIDLYRE